MKKPISRVEEQREMRGGRMFIFVCSGARMQQLRTANGRPTQPASNGANIRGGRDAINGALRVDAWGRTSNPTNPTPPNIPPHLILHFRTCHVNIDHLGYSPSLQNHHSEPYLKLNFACREIQ